MKNCPVCDSEYDREKKIPLILQCGHSFCKTCLIRSDELHTCLLPECKKDWSDTAIDDLPIVHQFLEDKNECKDHGDVSVVWCCTHSRKICASCLETPHSRCRWYPLKRVSLRLLHEIKHTLDISHIGLDENVNYLRKLRLETQNGMEAVENMEDELKTSRLHIATYLKHLDAIDADLIKSEAALRELAEEFVPQSGTRDEYVMNLQAQMNRLEQLRIRAMHPGFPTSPLQSKTVKLALAHQEGGTSSSRVRSAQRMPEPMVEDPPVPMRGALSMAPIITTTETGAFQLSIPEVPPPPPGFPPRRQE